VVSLLLMAWILDASQRLGPLLMVLLGGGGNLKGGIQLEEVVSLEMCSWGSGLGP
jgi:hypothetical protein